MVKGIIFDLDGTLVDCMPDFCHMIASFLKRIGVDVTGPIDEETVKSFIGNGAKQALHRILARYGIKASPKEEAKCFADYMMAYNAASLDRSHLFKNVFATLDILKKEGYKMAVCTNKPNRPALFILEKLGIKDFFHAIVTAEMTPFLKPDKEIMQIVMDRIGVDSCDAVMIGDSEVDLLAAKAVNIPAVLVSYGFSKVPVDTLCPDEVIDDFAALPQVLRAF